MVRPLVAAAVVLFMAGEASAQTAGDYLALKDRYLTAAPDVIGTLAKWPQSAIRQGVSACARSGRDAPCDARSKRLAAMLHTELVQQWAFSVPALATFHVDMAKSLIAATSDRPEFAERWFEFVTMVFLAEGFIFQADTLAGDAVARFPNSGRARAARALVTELRATIDGHDLRGHLLGSDRMSAAMRNALASAESDYRRAINMDPTLTGARLRMGWTLLLRRDTRAKQEFETVLQAATSNESRYLAQLFLATMAIRENRLVEASERFEAARQAGPAHQTACVAASNAAAALGDSERAKALALACLNLPQTTSDPWWVFRFGGWDSALLDWLHADMGR